MTDQAIDPEALRLANRVNDYRLALRDLGVPDDLAFRLVQDWHWAEIDGGEYEENDED